MATLIGNETAGAASFGVLKKKAYLTKRECTVTGKAEALHVHITTGSATTYRLAIYADSAGKPGALLAETGTITVAKALEELTVEGTIAATEVKAGTVYWIGILALAGTAKVKMTEKAGWGFISTAEVETFAAASITVAANGFGEPAPVWASGTEGAAESFSGAAAQSTGLRQTLVGSKAATSAVSQAEALRQTVAAAKSTSATVAQKEALQQAVSALKVASGSTAQREALRQSISALKAALGGVTQKEALRQTIAAAKTAVGSISQSEALRQAVTASKTAASQVAQTFGLRQTTEGNITAEGFAGAVTQALGLRQTVASGGKVAAASVAQKEALRQTVAALKVASGSTAQREALRQTAIGGKSVTKALAQTFGLRQTTEGNITAEGFAGAVTQALGLRQTVASGGKVTSGQAVQRLGLRQIIGPEEVGPLIGVLINLVLAYVPARQPAIAWQPEPVTVAADVPARGTHTVHEK